MDPISKLYYIHKTVIRMLHDRGYIVPSMFLKMTLDQFKDHFQMDSTQEIKRDRMMIGVQSKDDPTDNLFVFFPDDEKLGVKPIQEMYKKMEAAGVQKAIIVAKGLTSFAKQTIAQLTSGVRMEHFQETELLVNITEHQLVPKHVVMTKDEKVALLEKYKLKEQQLPRIQASDPVARYYGLQKGEVVKIIRPSETAGRYVTYRLVV